MSLPVKEILTIGYNQLASNGDIDADIDSKMLYCFMTGIDRSKLFLEYQKILEEGYCDKYFTLLDERCTGKPTQYIIGSQEFMGLNFDVDERVLIPRQDTETLVEDVMSVINDNKLRDEVLLEKKKKEFDVLDLGCGCGAIGVSLAALCKNARVTCSDISEGAIELARENGRKLADGAKISFECGNMLKPYVGRFRSKKFDIIVSNPPYIKTSVIQTLQTEVKDFEPMQALDGGSDGLDFYKEIIKDAPECLKKEGILIFEIGHDQKEEIMKLMEDSGNFEKIQGHKDLAGRDRVVAGVLKGKKKK